MGKVSEAILKAEKENPDKFLVPVRRPEMLPALPGQAFGADQPTEEWFRELKTRILTSSPKHEIHSIMFTGVAVKCGTTTVATRFAHNLAKYYKSKILLIDANLKNPTLHQIFDGDNSHALWEFLDRNGLESQLSGRSGDGKVFVLTCDDQQDDLINLLESNRFKEFLDGTKSLFDLVIIDAPPIAAFSEAKLLGTQVDGVVLIVEAGRSRKHVALRAKAEIEASKGRLLGVVLNKRKYFIPKWLYRKL